MTKIKTKDIQKTVADIQANQQFAHKLLAEDKVNALSLNVRDSDDLQFSYISSFAKENVKLFLGTAGLQPTDVLVLVVKYDDRYAPDSITYGKVVGLLLLKPELAEKVANLSNIDQEYFNIAGLWGDYEYGKQCYEETLDKVKELEEEASLLRKNLKAVESEIDKLNDIYKSPGGYFS